MKKKYDSNQKNSEDNSFLERKTNQVGLNGGCQEVLNRYLEDEYKTPKIKYESNQPSICHLPLPKPVYKPNPFDIELKPPCIRKPFEIPGEIRPLPWKLCKANWNSVLLFFNLSDAVSIPADYQQTTSQDALNFLDEGDSPADVKISDFMRSYWCTLSYGNLAFGIDTPRGVDDQPIIHTAEPTNGMSAWGEIIKLCVEANGQAIWQAAGGLMLNGKRWIPSVVLVQRYFTGISATYGSRIISSGGIDYEIGDQHHMHYNTAWSNVQGDGGNATIGRMIWGRMCHEYAHNFLEFGDLYHGAGCTGYWDLLGDNSPTTRMSEVCSHMKNRIGWLEYKQVIEGPYVPEMELVLRPYTTTGEAIKIVPEPEKNPNEFFLLEFRKSTGDENWRPDGGLVEEGLLITHINTNMLGNGHSPNKSRFLRDAPFFDPEFADFSDNGGTVWTGHARLQGILYPQPDNDQFTPTSQPNSNYYGYLDSGLEIKNISVVNGMVHFSLQINSYVQVGWEITGEERGVAGHFFDDPLGGTEQIFFRDAERVGLLVLRQAQWLVEKKQVDWIGEWNLGPDNYEIVGDLDGDGFDEIYIRSPNWAGVLKWQGNRFQSVTVQHDWIMQWNLGADNSELAVDVDGDGADEIFIRSPNWAGVIKLEGGVLKLKSIHHDWIDQWNLRSIDQHWCGRFTQSHKDEILIRSNEWLGLLFCEDNTHTLKLKSIQHDWIDQWNLGPNDRHYIGDYDGDGMDEIYIRSANWAGLLKWNGNRFQLLWIEHLTLSAWDDSLENAIDLTGNDESYAGHFLDDRDGILHRYDNGIALLHWRDNEMRVWKKYKSRFAGRWSLGENDSFITGQFVKGGPDVANPANIIVQPGLTGIFLHNAWGTSCVGVNHFKDDPDLKEKINLFWIKKDKILFSST